MTLGQSNFAANIVFEFPVSPKTLIDVKSVYIYLCWPQKLQHLNVIVVCSIM